MKRANIDKQNNPLDIKMYAGATMFIIILDNLFFKFKVISKKCATYPNHHNTFKKLNEPSKK